MNPGQAAELSTELSVLLGNVGSHVAELEHIAYGVMKTAMEIEETSVAKAELSMRSSKEWKDYRKAKAMQKSVEETIIALRHKVRAEERELNLT